ncbi:MAG: leucine-rich repeat domain-containing protein [Promethearchaeota archaeon]
MEVILNVTYEDGNQQGTGVGNEDLRNIKLENRQIKNIDLSPLTRCLFLRYLDLSQNSLEKIDLSPLGPCKNLRVLYLHENKLTKIDLSTLQSCTNLERLSLSNNQLRKIDLNPLGACHYLREFKLYANKLKTIDLSPLKTCFNLTDIYLGYNKFRTVDLSSLSFCQSLGKITLQGNSPRSIDITPVIATPSFWRVETEARTTVTSWIDSPFGGEKFVYRDGRNHRLSSVKPPAPKDSWKFYLKLASITPTLSISIQTYILNSLGFEDFGFIDSNLSDLMRSIPLKTPIKEAKDRLRTYVVSKVCDQVEQGGTTLGLNLESLLEVNEIMRRWDKISHLRDSEMRQVTAKRYKNMYDVRELYLTAYGYKLLNNLDLRGISGLEEEDFNVIRDIVESIGYEIEVVDCEISSTYREIPELSPQSNKSIELSMFVVKLYNWNKQRRKQQEIEEFAGLRRDLAMSFKKSELRAIFLEHVPFGGRKTTFIKLTKDGLALRISLAKGVGFVKRLLEEKKKRESKSNQSV